MSAEDLYIETLKEKIISLQEIILKEKNEVINLLESIKLREEQIDYIIRLLEAEGISRKELAITSPILMSVSDIAYKVLAENEEQEPVHYRTLLQAIMANGKLIPGKDPGANLISHLSRDNRFVRTAPGTYGLEEWGLKPMSKNRKIRRRKRTNNQK